MKFKCCKLCYRPNTFGRVRDQGTSSKRAALNLLGLFHWRGEPQLCLIRNLNAKKSGKKLGETHLSITGGGRASRGRV